MVFRRPGIVPVYCNFHPQMVAYVVVVPNALFARPDEAGRFVLAGVPPGRYTLVAWFPFAPPVRREIAVGSGKEVTADVTLQERSGAGLHLDKEAKPYGSY